MRFTKHFIFFSTIVNIFFIGGFASAQFTITVTITGLKNAQGQICGRIYTNNIGFPIEKGQSKYELIYPLSAAGLKNNTFTLYFTNLTPGTYAVSVLHDENSNGVFDTTFFGMPAEGSGTSMNIRPRFSPPRFPDSIFTITNHSAIQIKLFY